ncbi:uncharacterized protein LOC133178540 isoform X2 [Saccostrea echinata]|uniref:uncharacterized protein LOC133178540 isoform X2 n=1 Tax=Saccostrea echinata TaxID=191078 RepID=UPI002A7F1E38|nr:uncharacterized protein LOC133178540 isoform X2 [Saccostrea echinata]
MNYWVTYTTAVSPLDSEFCGISKLTREVVDSCPSDKESWNEAAEKFNCLQYEGKCTRTLEYHCLINPWQNITVAVCAPSTRIRSGHCAEYNARGGKIQEFYIPNCKSCTRDYMSTEAYKYQECYEEVYKKVKIPEKGGTQTETQQQRQQQEQQFKPRVGALGDVSEGNRIRSSRYISFYVFVLCIMTVL